LTRTLRVALVTLPAASVATIVRVFAPVCNAATVEKAPSDATVLGWPLTITWTEAMTHRDQAELGRQHTARNDGA